MKCNLTKLVRCMLLVVMTVVGINIVVFLNNRPGEAGLFNEGLYHLHHNGHRIDNSHVFTSQAPLRLNSTVTCPGLQMRERRPEGEFQTINGPHIYIYSAHLDGSKVLIIALREQFTPGALITCQMWYQVKGGEPLVLTEAEIQNLPEDHNRKYSAAFIYCRLPGHMRNETPHFVSLVAGDKCGPANNILILTSAPAKMDTQFTVCVTPLNYKYSRAYELVEMIEMNKILGAQKFVFYNHSTGSNVDRVLEMYSRDNEVEVHQWHLPIKVDTWPPTGNPEIHYFAQLSALNDCLYRHRHSSRYLVYQDLDEFIIPQKHDSWGELIREREKLIGHPTVLVFKCVFFRKEWPKPAHEFEAAAEKYKSVILTNTIREKAYLSYGTRSKFIVNPRKTSVIGVHNVWTFLENMDTVPESEASLHHYRSWEIPNDPIARVEDEAAALKYGSRLVEKIQTVWSKLEGIPMDINIRTYGDHV